MHLRVTETLKPNYPETPRKNFVTETTKPFYDVPASVTCHVKRGSPSGSPWVARGISHSVPENVPSVLLCLFSDFLDRLLPFRSVRVGGRVIENEPGDFDVVVLVLDLEFPDGSRKQR